MAVTSGCLAILPIAYQCVFIDQSLLEAISVKDQAVMFCVGFSILIAATMTMGLKTTIGLLGLKLNLYQQFQIFSILLDLDSCHPASESHYLH